MKLKKEVDGLKISIGLLLIGALILYVFSWYMWHRFIYMSDKNIVWSAIENALKTNGVEVLTDDSNDALLQKTTMHIDFTGDISTESRSEYKDDTLDTVVKTLSTKEKDYLYYEKNDSKKNPQLKQLEGTWVDISEKDQVESRTLANNLTNGSLIFVGTMPSAERKKLLKEMKSGNLYSQITAVKSSQVDGHEVRTFKATMNAGTYNKILSSYFKAIQLDQASGEVQLEAGEDRRPVIEIAVDIRTRRVFSAGYPTTDSFGAREYRNWGAKYTFDQPQNPITIEELQNKTKAIYTP